jgi:hypothetical protein
MQINNIPEGYTAVQEVDGSVSLIKQQVPSTLDTVHAALVAAGAQIPTAIAAPLTAAALPSAIDAGFNVVTNLTTGNYIAAATQGIPLLVSGIVALYANFSQPKGKTDAQITTDINALSRDQLIELLRSNSTSQVQSANSITDSPGITNTVARPVASSSN